MMVARYYACVHNMKLPPFGATKQVLRISLSGNVSINDISGLNGDSAPFAENA